MQLLNNNLTGEGEFTLIPARVPFLCLRDSNIGQSLGGRRTLGCSLQCSPVAIPACRSACSYFRAPWLSAGSRIRRRCCCCKLQHNQVIGFLIRSIRRSSGGGCTRTGERLAAHYSAHRWPYPPSAGVPAAVPGLPGTVPAQRSVAAGGFRMWIPRTANAGLLVAALTGGHTCRLQECLLVQIAAEATGKVEVQDCLWDGK